MLDVQTRPRSESCAPRSCPPSLRNSAPCRSSLECRAWSARTAVFRPLPIRVSQDIPCRVPGDPRALFSRRARCDPGIFDHSPPSNCARAALTAVSTSWAAPAAILVSTRLGGGVDDVVGVATACVGPFAIDVHLAEAGTEIRHGLRCCAHDHLLKAPSERGVGGAARSQRDLHLLQAS